MKKVVLVDYGVGNLLSVARALEAVNAHVILSSNADEIISADRVVLPGVGAFGHCMQEIKKRNLAESIKTFISKQRPLLGICVGMQVLCTIGTEFGHHEGLDIINGTVDKIPATSDTGLINKIPYVGWAKLQTNITAPQGLQNALQEKWFYLVHSFMAKTLNPDDTAAFYNYNDCQVTACIAKDNVMGVQFHPEKSSEHGLNFFKYFLSL